MGDDADAARLLLQRQAYCGYKQEYDRKRCSTDKGAATRAANIKHFKMIECVMTEFGAGTKEADAFTKCGAKDYSSYVADLNYQNRESDAKLADEITAVCSDGGFYEKIGYQSRQNLFSSGNKASNLVNENDPKSNKFLAAGLAKYKAAPYKSSDGKYKFKIVWGLTNGKSVVAEWEQTSYPTDTGSISGFEQTSDDDSYEKISEYSTCNGFKGLAKSNTGSCFLDGNGANGCWWNCVGAVKQHNGGIPGPNGKIADSMQFFLYKNGGSVSCGDE